MSKKTEDYDKDLCDIPEEACDYYLKRIYPVSGNLMLYNIASR